MDDSGTTFPPPPPVHSQNVALNATPSSAPFTTQFTRQTTSEGSHKPKPSFLKDIRRTSSANTVDSSNATTSWTVGQQNIQNSISSPSLAQHNTASSPLVLASPAATAMVRPTLVSRESEGGQSEGTSMGTQDPLSAKSKFMRVLNKFKGKHLHKGLPLYEDIQCFLSTHVYYSARKPVCHADTKKFFPLALPVRVITTSTLTALYSSSRSSTSGPSTTAYNSQPPKSVSNASSFILPSTQVGQVESIEYTDQGSTAYAARSDVSSASMRSYVEPSSARQKEPAHDADMSDSDKRRVIRLDQNRPGHSSLRAKFKNQVSNTLASIKSSSNLRDKARSQASSSATSPTSPVSPQSTTSQDRQGSNITADSEPLQSSAPKNRHSKGFWTFPRSRPDSQIAKSLRSANGGPSSAEQPSLQPLDQDLDTVMLSPELAPLDHDDGADSDHSIDIIMPGDYDDYTQFAELPLKKRKKLEAAAAAAAAAAALNPTGKSARGMKRFLLHPKNIAEGDKGKKKITEPFPSGDPGTSVIPQRSSRKRPKDQDSIEQNIRHEPYKMAKPNSGERLQWRRAIMRSLHLGRRHQAEQGISTSLQADSTFLSIQSHRDSGVYPDGQGPQSGQHESLQSARSKSLASSTHAALLATTPSKSQVPGSRRETLEMAMRRRRRSSAARSSILDPRGSLNIPGGLTVIDDDNASSYNITHTFTSFTLELAELHHAHAVVNNSATPGLFNFKRQSRALLPAADVEYEFRSFDSDGDAVSGYTGDADISMEEIFVRPRTPALRSTPEGKDKGKAREASSPDTLARRRISSVEGESDTVPELPTLSIRTRDLNRSSSGGGGGSRPSGRESPRSPRKAGATSPTLHRKPSRQFLNGSYISSADTPSPGQLSGNKPSIDETVALKSRNILQPARPSVPALNTKQPLSVTKGSRFSSATTLAPSSQTPHSATSLMLTQFPGLISPTGFAKQESLHHQRNSSSYSQYSNQHQQQASSDTLLPHHLKNFSTASTLSAGSSYSAQTLTGGNGPGPLLSTSQPVEFDPSQEFPPTTPVDLKAMDFDTLLKAAEREQQKGSDDLRLKKRKSYQFKDLQSLKERHNELNAHVRADSDVIGKSVVPGQYSKPLNPKSSLTAALVKSAPNLDELRTRGGGGGGADTSSGVGTSRSGKPGIPTSRADPLRIPASRSAISFDVDENAVAIAAGASRGNPRTKRVMKKKMSVIKLSGNVQGRREDDGVIRVSVSSPSGDFRQARAY
ncbi:hypothetical protein BG015_000426 [Linnemannia schmuckeri]|uniref:Uncharacterized protein n=1 Tax=Linnemannia schmuckeri TaxID=64567 RepID=A0A9P5RUJ6_9FUNG|nr:hypothetical protein BG015_000426 [Linnemannia schmuckeri]